MARKKDSPVSVGDTVYVACDRKFTVTKATVTGNPSDHLWVSTDGKGSVFVGPHRWANTKAEASAKALELATKQRRELTEKLADVQKIITALGGK